MEPPGPAASAEAALRAQRQEHEAHRGFEVEDTKVSVCGGMAGPGSFSAPCAHTTYHGVRLGRAEGPHHSRGVREQRQATWPQGQLHQVLQEQGSTPTGRRRPGCAASYWEREHPGGGHAHRGRAEVTFFQARPAAFTGAVPGRGAQYPTTIQS